MKKMIFAVAALVGVAMAADAGYVVPATLGEQTGLQVRSGRSPQGRSGCPDFKALYYYSGDFDSTNQWADALSNEADIYVSSGSQVYQVFLAKGTTTKRHLRITGLCVNSIDVVGGIDNPTPYEVRSGAKVGSGGTLVCRGMATSTDRLTFNFDNEFAHEVKVRNCIVPAPRKGVYYWVNLQPQCFKANFCSNGARYYNDTNDSNLNHIGRITPPGMALWNSVYYGENWVNPNAVQGGKYFLSFSVGVAGTLEK